MLVSGVFVIRSMPITLKLLVTLSIRLGVVNLEHITYQTFCIEVLTVPKFEMRNMYIKPTENIKCRRSRKLEYTDVRRD